MPATLPLGTDFDGQVVYWDLASAPHLQVVGGAGAGKTALARNLADSARARDWSVTVVEPTGELAGGVSASAAATSLERAAAESGNRPILVIVDDALALAASQSVRTAIDTIHKKEGVGGVHLVVCSQWPILVCDTVIMGKVPSSTLLNVVGPSALQYRSALQDNGPGHGVLWCRGSHTPTVFATEGAAPLGEVRWEEPPLLPRRREEARRRRRFLRALTERPGCWARVPPDCGLDPSVLGAPGKVRRVLQFDEEDPEYEAVIEHGHVHMRYCSDPSGSATRLSFLDAS